MGRRCATGIGGCFAPRQGRAEKIRASGGARPGLASLRADQASKPVVGRPRHRGFRADAAVGEEGAGPGVFADQPRPQPQRASRPTTPEQQGAAGCRVLIGLGRSVRGSEKGSGVPTPEEGEP